MKLVILVVVLIVAQSSVESKNDLVVLEQKNGVSIKATIKATKSTIAQKIFDLVYKETGIKMSSGYSIFTVGGGYFFSIANQMVCAAYYHNTKKHSATADGGFIGGGVITQIANKDYWAVACSMNGLFGRKTYYNVYN